ncbi:MAG: ferritin-like domain-containing protein [Rhodospirillaceae bacterium]
MAKSLPVKHWTLDDIDWSRFDGSKVSADLLQVIKTAALVERNGAHYGRYLCNVFSDDPEFCDVARQWAAEEEQHGLALGKWASVADPDFDFDASFAQFLDMYHIPTETTDSIRGSRAGELCARCVVETGTSSFYSALRDAVEEPVLRQICKNIAADEFRHYKMFFVHMERYARGDAEATSLRARWNRMRVAFTRFREADDDEIASAYHAANAVAGPYSRAAANDAYSQRVFGFYQARHARRAGHMFAQAAGMAPNGWAARLVIQLLWLVVRFRGRKYRPLLAGT